MTGARPQLELLVQPANAPLERERRRIALGVEAREPERGDEYVGTLVNAYLRRGGQAIGVPAGERYYDVGTVEGYRAAIDALRPVAAGHEG